MIKINTWLHGDTTKIDFCGIMAKKSKISHSLSVERVSWSEIMRTVFSIRLPEDDYNGIIIFMESFDADATLDDIQNSLVMFNIVQITSQSDKIYDD